MPSGCNVCNSRIQKLSFFCLWFSFQLVVNDINFGSAKVFQWVPRQHKVLTHGQERLFRKVTDCISIWSPNWKDIGIYWFSPSAVRWKPSITHQRYYRLLEEYGKIWEQRTDQEPPTECLVEMLTLVLLSFFDIVVLTF